MSEDTLARTDEFLPSWLAAARARTPARVLVGRAESAYPTATQLALRADHAAALDAVHPAVVALLIGELPALATAESLSAYLAYRPRLGHTDAQRNLQ